MRHAVRIVIHSTVDAFFCVDEMLVVLFTTHKRVLVCECVCVCVSEWAKVCVSIRLIVGCDNVIDI